jgi:hypothetical protein
VRSEECGVRSEKKDEKKYDNPRLQPRGTYIKENIDSL